MADTPRQLELPFSFDDAGVKKEENGLPFPVVLLPPSGHPNYTLQSLVQAIVKNRGRIERLLSEVGALLFRGFPLKTASDFNAFLEAFGWEEQPQRDAANRIRVQGMVFTANEAPLHQPITFHHEMSLFEDFPSKLAFFCEVAPPHGGETSVVLSHKITERMTERYPEFVAKMEKDGLFYSAHFAEEDDPNSFIAGWKTHFGTDDKEEAQIKAEECQYKWKVRWEGSTMICEKGPIVSIRAFDAKNKKKKAWFNNLALGANTTFTLGDGSIVPREAIDACLEIMEEERVDVKWQVGDVVLVDNRLALHARRPSKPPRRVLAAFAK